MSCDKIDAWLTEEATGALSPEHRLALEAHVATCPSCRAARASTDKITALLKSWPDETPRASSSERFYHMLEAHRQGAHTTRRAERSLPRTALALAAALILAFCAGLLVPFDGNRTVGPDPEELETLRRTVSLSLMAHTSPTERLEGVYRARDSGPGRRVRETLLHLVEADPNVNVRLAAVEALFAFRAEPEVRAGMVRALADQEDPLIQLALIDALVVMDERDVEARLRDLLSQRDVEPLVRERAMLGLEVMQ